MFVFQNTIFMDYDFDMKMERLNISSYNPMTMASQHMMVWRDYNTVREK